MDGPILENTWNAVTYLNEEVFFKELEDDSLLSFFLLEVFAESWSW